MDSKRKVGIQMRQAPARFLDLEYFCHMTTKNNDLILEMKQNWRFPSIVSTVVVEQNGFKRLSATLIRCIVLIYGRTMQIQVAHQLKSGNNTQCAHPDKHHNFISQPHYIQVSSLALASMQPLWTDFGVCWWLNWHIVLLYAKGECPTRRRLTGHLGHW